MTADLAFNRYLARYPSIAAAAYIIVIVAFLATIWIALADIFAERANLASSVDILNQLEARQRTSNPATLPGGAVPAGSPFLGGETITVGGAALLQRVAGAIAQVGGSVQSSQVDLQGPKSKDGFITLLISCEMEQASLQKMLYDLEAGTPFLFVDQLVVQGPQETAVAGSARMRVLVAVKGQWKGTK
ncbi:MAG: type II secretion system protein M [Rhizobiales bacterium]|nr:type II secretion system protein M [Hyphomicrobiales bacterium]